MSDQNETKCVHSGNSGQSPLYCVLFSCPTGTPRGKGQVKGIWNNYLGEIIVLQLTRKLKKDPKKFNVFRITGKC
jgi:hypothetical protein